MSMLGISNFKHCSGVNQLPALAAQRGGLRPALKLARAALPKKAGVQLDVSLQVMNLKISTDI